MGYDSKPTIPIKTKFKKSEPTKSEEPYKHFLLLKRVLMKKLGKTTLVFLYGLSFLGLFSFLGMLVLRKIVPC